MSGRFILRLLYIGFCLLWLSCSKEEVSQTINRIDLKLKELNPQEDVLLVADTVLLKEPWVSWEALAYQPERVRRILMQGLGFDSVVITQLVFSEDYLAYGLFAKIKGDASSKRQIKTYENRVYLRNKKRVSEVKLPQGETWNVHNLKDFLFLSEDTESTPALFKSLPRKGKREGSHRVIVKQFLGWDDVGEAVGASYPCYLESLFLFRTFFNPWQKSFSDLVQRYTGVVDTLSSGELRFKGTTNDQTPLFIIGHSTGLLGGIGCSDERINESIAKKALELNFLTLKSP